MLWELSELVGKSVEDLKKNWEMAIENFCGMLNITGKQWNLDGKSIQVLFNLPKVFAKAKESGKILHTYPVR